MKQKAQIPKEVDRKDKAAVKREPFNSRLDVAGRENSVASYIPYSAQVDGHTVKTKAGDYLQIIRLDGIAHESADDTDISLWAEHLNGLFKNIAGPDVAIWTHTVRRPENTYPKGRFEAGFAADLNSKYQAHLATTTMMVNELYLTLMLRPQTQVALRWFSALENIDRRQLLAGQRDTIDRLNDLTINAIAALNVYGPRRLACYEKDGRLYSEVLAFLGFLVNGETQEFVLPRAPLAQVLATSRPFFGRESFELRAPTERILGAILSIKEYPEATAPGLLNELLSAPFSLILTQSFSFLSRPVATALMERQQHRMINAGDLAQSQVEAISDALDDLTSGRFVMGEHHLTLTVLTRCDADDAVQIAASGKRLKQHLAGARAALANSGMVVAREDLALEAAFWAQLPGNFKYRPRPAPLTSRNLAGFASLHNYPSGRRSGNAWGPALTLFKTASGTPYYFNFHEALDRSIHPSRAEPSGDTAAAGQTQSIQGQNDTNRSGASKVEQVGVGVGPQRVRQKALGNTTIIGPSGSGKTVVQAFLAAQVQKYRPNCVIFDKDRGLELFVRAMGGVYMPLKNGEPSGLNPLQLEPTPDNQLFLQAWVAKLITGSGAYVLSVKEEKDIAFAVNAVLTGLQKSGRRLSSLLAFMDMTNPEGAGARLAKWCEREQGALAWAFDQAEDRLALEPQRLFGFDVTEFLDKDEVRTPVIMYLFHRINSLIDGKPFVCFMDEFWKLLLDPYFEAFAQDGLKTIRKKDGLFVFGTQSAADVLKSPIAHSIVEQCATFLFMPNPKASVEDYVQGFKLTEREFEIISRELSPGSRRFLVKQGHHSVVAELNLQGFDDELAVLSGSTDNILLLERILDELGPDPTGWLPEFHRRRRL